MTNYIIEFPGLGLTLNPPAGFSIGGFEIRFYGLIIALGLILGVVYALKRRQEFGISPRQYRTLQESNNRKNTPR